MELRVLQYFLAVAREGNITRAADSLFLSQPTLSRQIKELEDELGKQLIIRGNRKITLTEEGMILRKRAQEIMDLVQKTENEISVSDADIIYDIYIGAGETEVNKLVFDKLKEFQNEFPLVRFHINSGDSLDLMERLEKGLLDFAIIFDPFDRTKYHHVPVPAEDVWGFFVKKDSPLAEKEYITREDVIDMPLIMPRRASSYDEVTTWFGTNYDNLNVVATHNLAFNASLLVSQGMGVALTLDKIINTTGTDIVFVPLYPPVTSKMNIVWKKYQVQPRPMEKLIEKLKEIDK